MCLVCAVCLVRTGANILLADFPEHTQLSLAADQTQLRGVRLFVPVHGQLTAATVEHEGLPIMSCHIKGVLNWLSD